MSHLPKDFAPARVVIVRPRGLGDVVLSSAVIDALRRAWPDAAIDYVTERASRELLEPDSRLDGRTSMPAPKSHNSD